MRPINVASDLDLYWKPNDDISRYFYRKLCSSIFSMYLDAPTYLHIYLDQNFGVLKREA